MSFLIVLVVVLNLNCIYSDICADIDYDCDACIGNSFRCVWCTDEIHNDTRCRLEGNPIVNSDWCQNIVNPVAEPAELIKNEDFRPKTKTAAAVQLRPQHVAIKARPFQTVKFPMSYKPDLERPIDVYYLFDNSKLAKLYKKHLDTQAPKIYEGLREISGDVRIGIGSLDTISIQASEKVFRNILSLTKDISRSVDGRENGSVISTLLQGLMEAIESEEINGIHNGRRTIVALFCDPWTSAANANTTLQEEYKYINKIKKIVQNKHINVIFIGQKDFPDEYKVLAEKFVGASYVELNDIDEDHVDDLVSLIKDEYLKTVYNLELTFGAIPPHLSVKVTPACEKFGSRCIRKVQGGSGTSMHMLVTVFSKQCPNDYKHLRTVTITAIGSHEALTIDTDALCYCKCKEKIEANSVKCNLMGDYTCGICKCKEGRFGDSCQCIGDQVEDGWAKCRADPWDYICSNHGDCICGVCICYEGYEGQLCGDVVVKQ